MVGMAATTVDLDWEGGLKFTVGDAYGHELTVDAPAEEGQPFDGFKPGELLLASLAGCSGVDVVNILRKQRQNVSGVHVRIRGVQEPEPPWTWVQVDLEYVVRGKGLRRVAVERAIRLSETKYCSVGATIGGTCRIKSSLEIIEEEDGA